VSDKARTRVSVTMTKPYVEAMDYLIERGIYLNRGEIVLDALRYHLASCGLEPFCSIKGTPSLESRKQIQG